MKTNQKLLLMVVLFCFTVMSYTLYPKSLLAIESTRAAVHPIPTGPTASPSTDIQSKLKALQAEIASKAANLKLEVSKKLQNRAYIGYIKNISTDSITLALPTGTKIVRFNTFTEYENQTKTSKVKFTIKGLKVEDYVAALGDVDETEVLTARKIIKLQSAVKTEKEILFGQVAEISGQTINLKTKDNQTVSISCTPKTIFNSFEGLIALSNIKANNNLVAVLKIGQDNIKEAQYIYLLGNSSFLKLKTASPGAKIATPSAKPATKSAVKKN